MTHTPEPWTTESAPHRAFICQIGNSSNAPCVWTVRQAMPGEKYEYGDTQDDARRIVAAVNFCAGIPTDQLEDITLAEVVGALRDMTHGLPELLESIGYADEEGLIDDARRILSHFTPPTEPEDG